MQIPGFACLDRILSLENSFLQMIPAEFWKEKLKVDNDKHLRREKHEITFEIQRRLSKLQPQTHLPTHVRHAPKQCFSSSNDK